MITALSIHNLSCQYDGVTVLDSLNLEVERGEIVCLLGASGCGKTTLLKAVAGLIPSNSGEISLQGKQIDSQNIHVLPENRNIGLIFQDYALFPHLSVEQNVAFGLQNYTRKEKQQSVKKMLELVHLQGLSERYPHQLSGGQQQRVAIARSLAYQPDILLLDEPFSNIDTQVRHELIYEIRRIFKKQGVTAIFVTHSREEAFAFSDRLAVMNHGLIEQFGTASELYYRPSSPFVADFLGGGSYLDAIKTNEITFQTILGDIQAQFTEHISIGEECHLLLRPHNITIIETDESNIKVVEQQFMGDHCRYVINVKNKRLIAVSNHPIKIGTFVKLRITSEGVIAFPMMT